MSPKSSRSLAVLLLAAACTVSAGCVPYWTGKKMQKQIDTLQAQQEETTKNIRAKEAELTDMISSSRADVDRLNKVIKDATSLLQRNSADFGAEMGEIRQELESLRGKTEEAEFKLQKLQQDLELFKQDTDLRFSEGGSGANLPDDANKLFKFSADKMKSGDYRTARKGFEKFVAKFPKDRRLDEATFWVGEAYFKESQWVSAIYEYQKILKNHPKSDRMDDATFRIGQSFVKLGKCKEAKVFFETVVKDFKSSKFRPSAERELRKMKSGKCK